MDINSLTKFLNGTETEAYRYMGCHQGKKGSKSGFWFRVWAPHAAAVFLCGRFNSWSPNDILMKRLEGGIFECFSEKPAEGDTYKYRIISRTGRELWRADPFARAYENNSQHASIITVFRPFLWTDNSFRQSEDVKNILNRPMIIYEVHAGAWKRHPDGRAYSYRELAQSLTPYVKEMGYTHVELMPLTEYPNDSSWGYQVTGYYAPTCRYGQPDELKFLINRLHSEGIGVILDWVPAHFAPDEFALSEFDGESCYESAYTSFHRQTVWGTERFNFSRSEVCSFLISNAVYWVREFHVDGLRVDAVAELLGISSQKNGATVDATAVAFLMRLNSTLQNLQIPAFTAAEDSSALPNVTGHSANEGLGFSFKWNMGWTNDVLSYMKLDFSQRSEAQQLLTFGFSYAYDENYILPFSHDEVSVGKHSMIEKLPGSYEKRFAGLRLLYGFQIACPGKKLTFMGNELGHFREWNETRELDWNLLEFDSHRKFLNWIRKLNIFYLEHAELWERDDSISGFQWLQCDDTAGAVLSFERIGERKRIAVICNFKPISYSAYRIGFPQPCRLRLLLCSDEAVYGGTGNQPSDCCTIPFPWGGHSYSAQFILPSLSVSFYEIDD